MKKLIQAAMGKFGYELVKKHTVPSAIDHCLLTLKRLGLNPKHIVDIGANHGYWTRRALLHFPNSAYTLIEPQERLKVHVEDLLATNGNMQWITAGAGDENRTGLFTMVDQDDSCSFVPTPEQAASQHLKQVEIAIVTLNDVVARSKFPIPEMVKIDAEGFDLKVIDGASDLIGKTDVFFMESAVCAIGIENRLAKTIIKMDQLGYVPFDITDQNRSPRQGVLWLTEFAFVRRESAILAQITSQY